MRTSSLDVRIEEVATSKLWNKGIGSVSAMVYLQQSDSRRFTIQEMQRKSLGTSYVIGDARSKENIFAGNSEFLISVISNSGIKTMSVPFHLELIPKLSL
jgi:hypothetical protein